MQVRKTHFGLAALALAGFVSAAIPAFAQQKQETFGKAPQVQQSIPPKIGARKEPLKLSDEQRQKIAQELRTVHNAVPVAGDKNKSAREFEPKIGEAVPAAIKSDALPQSLYRDMPQLKQYEYAELKDQILIIDPLSKKIVDLFPRG